MNKKTTLALGLYSQKDFALGKGNMDPSSFKKLVDSLVKAFESAYGNNYQEYINVLEKSADFLLLIVQRKVPNVTKAIIEHPQLPSIQIAIKGLDIDGNPKIELLKAPFDQNKCKSVIPYYNKMRTPSTIVKIKENLKR